MLHHALAHDAINADYAAALLRWFELGASLPPDELRSRLAALELELSDGEQRRGLVLHLSSRHRQGSGDNGAGGGPVPRGE